MSNSNKDSRYSDPKEGPDLPGEDAGQTAEAAGDKSVSLPPEKTAAGRVAGSSCFWLPSWFSCCSSSSESSSKMKQGESGFLGASFNLTKTMVGGGIISLPSALKETGLLGGVLLLVAMATVTVFADYLLVTAATKKGQYSFQELSHTAFGRAGSLVISVFQFIGPWAGVVMYIIISGHASSAVLSAVFASLGVARPPPVLLNEMLLKSVLLLGVALPLSLPGSMRVLEKFSGLGLLMVLGLEGMVLYEMATMYCNVRCYDFTPVNSTLVPASPPCCPASSISLWTLRYRVFSGIGILATAYASLFNTFLIYNSMRQRSVTRYVMVGTLSTGGATLLYVVLATAGFITFVDLTNGDLVHNYCRSDAVASVFRALYAAMLLFSCPINSAGCREVLERELDGLPQEWIHSVRTRLCAGGRGLGRWAGPAVQWASVPSRSRRLALTLLVYLSVAAGSIPVSNLEAFSSITGSLVHLPLTFIIPSLLHLKLVSERGTTAVAVKILNLVLIAVGVGLILLGLGVGIYSAIAGSSRGLSPSPGPLYCPENRAGLVDRCPGHDQGIPLTGNTTSSSSSAAAAWGCNCGEVFARDYPLLCPLNLTVPARQARTRLIGNS